MRHHGNKYEELDKEVSKKIMKEFEGKVIEHMCADCHGEGFTERGKCKNCKGTGSVFIEY